MRLVVIFQKIKTNATYCLYSMGVADPRGLGSNQFLVNLYFGANHFQKTMSLNVKCVEKFADYKKY